MAFPKDFVWGAAAASYQIEGASRADGKGESVWDMFARKSGAIWRGHTADVACDHYHRYPDDIALWQQLGLRAYRMSVSWPRVLPSGTGRLNQAGIGFYDRLVDALLAAGITPWLTCFHWDFPIELYHRGGWQNRDSADWFADYVAVLAERLSDRVRHFMTFNEPQCFVRMGLATAVQAPGDKLREQEVVQAQHHVLLAHGKATQALRAHAKQPLQLGYAPVGVIAIPTSDSPADLAAAQRRMRRRTRTAGITSAGTTRYFAASTRRASTRTCHAASSKTCPRSRSRSISAAPTSTPARPCAPDGTAHPRSYPSCPARPPRLSIGR